MKQTFADTFFYLALLNPKDAAHELAVAANSQRTGLMVTTQWVLTELADALARPVERPRFLTLLATMETDADVVIVPADADLFGRGVDLFRRRHDKDWPLTDCFSFVVMRELGIVDALTADQHFLQAGFNPLMIHD